MVHLPGIGGRWQSRALAAGGHSPGTTGWCRAALERRICKTGRPLFEVQATRYPRKQEWMNKYLGILIFKLRPRSVGQ